ncbi:MAG: Gfo/Idh/MocA family oxidoreductase [Deltaproteobacteria bacterium]
MRKLRIGIVGLGRVASKTHIPVLKSLKTVEVVAGAETISERAERVKTVFGLNKVYESYVDMYQAENLDGVYVCLPNFLHKDASKRALEYGLNVLCEKPMGISVEEASEITALAENKGLVLMPGFKKRYASNFVKAKRLIDEGLLGKIVNVQGTFVTPGPYLSWDPKSDWYLDKKWHGVIYDSACHLVDLLLLLLPYEVQRVKLLRTEGFNGYNTPTNVACVFEMEGGILGDLCIGWRASTDILSLAIHGTAGTLVVSRDYFEYANPGTDPVDRIMMFLHNVTSESKSLLRTIKNKVRGRDFYSEDFLQAVTFCNAILGLEKEPINGKSAILVHKFLEMMVHSD